MVDTLISEISQTRDPFITVYPSYYNQTWPRGGSAKTPYTGKKLNKAWFKTIANDL